MNIIEALDTPELFGDTFQSDSWATWRAVLSAAFALPMDQEQEDTYKRLAGGRELPSERVSRLVVVAGRRSAKTHVAAAIAVYLGTVGAAVENLTGKLAPGERGVIFLCATDRSQAKVALNFITGLFDQSPVLSAMIQKRNAESLDLNNGVSIEVATASFRSIRGRAMLAFIGDEIAFFRDSATSAANDKEIIRAATPGLATTGGLLVAISSPWAQRGWLYEQYRKHYGQDSKTLVIKGATTEFNPTLPLEVIEEALLEDAESAKTEWLGEFRDSIASYVDRATVESCTRPRPIILPPEKGKQFTAFVDPAGGGSGSNADHFTLSIGYKEKEKVIVCGVWGKRGNPAAITEEFSQILKAYGCKKAYSDKYAGQYPATEFKRHGITLKYTDKNRSQLYTELLPMLNTGQIELPADTVLINQLSALERTPGRLTDIVNHSPGSHDDFSNAVAGLAYHARSGTKDYPKFTVSMY